MPIPIPLQEAGCCQSQASQKSQILPALAAGARLAPELLAWLVVVKPFWDPILGMERASSGKSNAAQLIFSYFPETAVGQNQWDPILVGLVNSPPILEPILVVGLNRMFTGAEPIWLFIFTHGHGSCVMERMFQSPHPRGSERKRAPHPKPIAFFTASGAGHVLA